MHFALCLYGSLEVRSGGNLYDRKLVSRLRAGGHRVDEISLRGGGWGGCLARGLRSGPLLPVLSGDWDLLLQDELAHPTLFRVNRRLRRRGAYPIVAIVHHLRSSERHPAVLRWLYRAVEKAYLRSVDAFLFNSTNTREQVEVLVGNRTPGLVAHPGGDRLVVPPRTEAVSRPEQPLRLVFVGNLIERKNLEAVLRAMARARLHSTLEVIGSTSSDPRYVRGLRRMVAELGLESRVHFAGPLEDEELGRRLAEAHVLVAPSSWEGFGIVYLEGMAFGLPAIASRAGAAQEVVTEGETGFLVEPDDVDTLVSRLDRMAGDRELLERMSAAARRGVSPKTGMGRVDGGRRGVASRAGGRGAGSRRAVGRAQPPRGEWS